MVTKKGLQNKTQVVLSGKKSLPSVLSTWVTTLLLDPAFGTKKNNNMKKVPSSHPSGALFDDVFINLKGGGLKHIGVKIPLVAEPNFQYQFCWGSLTITILPFLFKFQTLSMGGSLTPHGHPDVYPIGIPAWCVVPHLVASGSSAVGVRRKVHPKS